MLRLPLPTLALALVFSVSGLPSCIAVVREGPDEDYETVLEVVALQYAVAGDRAVSMNGLLQDPQSCVESEVTIVADARTNSLMLRGPRREVDRARETIAKLDREVH